jgi:hypothetical protein
LDAGSSRIDSNSEPQCATERDSTQPLFADSAARWAANSPPNGLLGQFEHTQPLMMAQTPFFKVHGMAIGVAGAR